MYHFAIVALLALATLKVVDYLDDLFGGLDKIKTLLTFGVAIGAVYALDYSVFAGWKVAVDDGWGKLITGFMVAGFTVPWRASFAYLTHDRAEVDEVLGGHGHMRKVA